MRNKRLILESVRERDIDLLFLEEWNTNIEFARWFVEETTFNDLRINSSIGYHSVSSDNLGETDLFLEYSLGNELFCMLLENKIDAYAQENQGSRYRKRAKNLEGKDYQKVQTCIIAPERYLTNNAEVKEYEFKISYEKIAQWFESQNNDRSNYRSMVLKLAIDQERRGYIAKADATVTKFWHDYWELLKTELPFAYMKEPYNIPEGSDWPVISFEWLPETWILRHKLSQGVIDLETDFTEAEIKAILSKIDNSSLICKKTGKSYSFRMVIEAIDRHTPLFEQYEKAKKAIKAIKTINDFQDIILKAN